MIINACLEYTGRALNMYLAARPIFVEVFVQSSLRFDAPTSDAVLGSLQVAAADWLARLEG